MIFKKSVLILGTRYSIIRKEFKKMDNLCGYTCSHLRQICVGLMDTYPSCVGEPRELIDASEKETLRHEIIHAFLNESGLKSCAGSYNRAWSRNEEMIDFFAIQSPKIFRTFQELDIL